DGRALVIVDRLTAGTVTAERLADSLELAFQHGAGGGVVLVQRAEAESSSLPRTVVDGLEYDVLSFNSRLICPECGDEFPDLEPALFNFNSPLGACPECRGTGEAAGNQVSGRSPPACPRCQGTRLRPEALAVRVDGRT